MKEEQMAISKFMSKLAS